MWRARERLQIDRPCDSIHAWVPSDRGESLCPVAKKPISENGESDQALASIASENFGLIERCGGFDESLDALEDWDLVLRYTAHAPAFRLPVLAVRYRVMDEKRILAIRSHATSVAKIRNKWALTEAGR